MFLVIVLVTVPHLRLSLVLLGYISTVCKGGDSASTARGTGSQILTLKHCPHVHHKYQLTPVTEASLTFLIKIEKIPTLTFLKPCQYYELFFINVPTQSEAYKKEKGTNERAFNSFVASFSQA